MANEVRRFRRSDESACAQIYLEARRKTFHWANVEAFHWNDFARDTKEETLWVAERGRRVVGFVSVYGPDAFVHHLYVAQSAQKLGIGSLLLKTASEQFSPPLRLKCPVLNQAACDFYTRRGWREVQRGQANLGPYILFETGAPAGD